MKVLKLKENAEGSIIITFELSEFDRKVIKRVLKVKKLTKKRINDFMTKSLLTYMFKAIEYRNIASVGYYIGGMKEKDLKQSENKTIILATFQMAEEGLDIKTLSTLFLASPKTDIVQAVGRILRIKHEQPLIIDLIDSHDIFQNQFNKRRAYYIKNKYKIQTTDNLNYFNNNFNIDFNPLEQSEKSCKKEHKCLINLN